MRTDNVMASRRCAVLVAALGAALTVGCSSIPTRESETVTELPTYSIQELGLLPGGSVSQASGVNGAGLVVGYATDAGGARRAVVFSGGTATRLPELPGTSASEARAVNDAGQIVGYNTVAGVQRPVWWQNASSAPVQLPTLGGPRGTTRAINGAGVILGQAADDDGELTIVYWTPDKEVHRVIENGGAGYEPAAINDAGQVAGNVPEEDDDDAGGGGDDDDDDDDGPRGGFRWEPSGELAYTGTLGADEVDVNAMSGNGVLVGGGEDASGVVRAFRWTAARGLVRLGAPLTGDVGVEANAVNKAGIVAATSFATDGNGNTTTSRAAITLMLETNAQFVALPDLGGTRASPVDNAINECGVIVGWAFPAGSTQRRAVAWVPEGCSIQ